MAIYDVNGNEIVNSSELNDKAMLLGLHLMPETTGELNMVRRARQFTDIKWTPSVNIKRRNAVEYDVNVDMAQGWQDTFLAGVEYTGIPYSHGYYNGAYRNFGMVGYQATIDAFATSVLFPDSYFNATDQYSTSSGIYTTYGATCDTLVCYAMGLDDWYGSDAGFQTLVNNGTIVLQFSGDNIVTNIDKVHLGDILWKKAVHVAIITDVLIDDNGDIYIEVSEATTRGASKPDENGTLKGGLSRRELWGINDFFTRFYGYNVYRYVDSENVTYEQNPFVTLQGESPLHNVRSNIPLIPYMGHNFSYISGHIPNSNVLIGSEDYSYLAVYKDGSLFNTFTIGSATSINVGFSSVGSYEAFLYNSSDGTVSNMTNRTVSCKWSVA